MLGSVCFIIPEGEMQLDRINSHLMTVTVQHNSEFIGLSEDFYIADLGYYTEAIEFEDILDGSIDTLEESIYSIIDTGDSMTFLFVGGGALTLEGVTGYMDLYALAIDYPIFFH